MNKIYALIDCNSFYASCEKIFRPDLKDKPVVVLSNNDGCIVALSAEAKKLGIKRATPIFKIKDLILANEVYVFSSNYSLYGDISDRVMEMLRDFSPDIEIYSIDEAFLELSDFNHLNLVEYSKKIRKFILKNIGIQTTVGIGQTKTLSKLANEIAKKHKAYGGVFNIIDHPNIEKIFKTIKVDNIWGVGRQYSKMLNENKIFTIYDLINQSDLWIKKHMTINGLYMVWELRGRPCIDLQQMSPDKKNIVCSRSFGTPITLKKHLREALAYYSTIACENLRKQKSLCSYINVFIATNRFKTHLPQYSKSITIDLDNPTSYTNDIIEVALKCLDNIYKNGFEYKKAGIILDGIISERKRQFDLFSDMGDIDKKDKMINVIDDINKMFGRETIHCGAFSYRKVWGMRQELKSPNYTTRWEDLPIVRV